MSFTKQYRSICCMIVCLSLVGFLSRAAEAQLVTWNGSSGGSWNVAGNWTPNMVPTTLEDATINSGQADVGAGVVGASGSLIVGDTGGGMLKIDSGGMLSSRDAVLGNQPGATGTVFVDDPSSRWDIIGDTTVGQAGNGTLLISAGGKVESVVGQIRVAVGSGTTGEITIDGSSSELIAQGGVILGDAAPGGNGTLNLRNNGLLTAGTFSSITINGPSTVNVESGGSIAADFLFTASGSLLNNQATIGSAGRPVLLANGGTLSGAGLQTGDLIDSGILAPNEVSLADDTAVYTIDGDWTKQSGSQLQVQLGGSSNGGGNKSLTEFDWIDITGDVSLDGTLDVQLTGGFSLGLLQEYEIINVGGTLSGQFDGLVEGSRIATLGGQNLHISYSGGDGNDVVAYTRSLFSADFDLSGDVDPNDLTEWQTAYGQNAVGDADIDGDSDGFDFLAWQRQLGLGSTASLAAIPEPSASVLLVLAVLTRCCLRR